MPYYQDFDCMCAALRSYRDAFLLRENEQFLRGVEAENRP
jgi:hypothetical protein